MEQEDGFGFWVWGGAGVGQSAFPLDFSGPIQDAHLMAAIAQIQSEGESECGNGCCGRGEN